MSDPKLIVQELYDAGLNEREITDELRKSGIDVSQATVNRIRCGQIKRTSFQIGAGLLALRDRFVAQKSA